MPSGPTLAEARSVIVFETGAVIRLAGDPPVGQLLVAINPHGREVPCRVVAPRNRPALKGYVEIEFCEPAGDFWGIHPTLEAVSVRNSAEPSAVPAAPALGSSGRNIPGLVMSAQPVGSQPKLAGHAPTFEDIPGLALGSPAVQPPTGAVEVRLRPKPSEPPALAYEVSKPVPAAPIAPLSQLPPPAPLPDFKPVATPSYSSQGKGITGMSALPETRSAGSPLPLVIGAVAVLILAGAGGFYYFHKSPSLSASEVSASVRQDSALGTQSAVRSSQQDQPLSSAPARAASAELNTTAAAATSRNDSAELVRPAAETTASFAENTVTKPATPAAVPQRQPAPVQVPSAAPSQIPNLKLGAPKVPARRPVNSSDATTLSAAEITSASPAASSAIGGIMAARTSSNVPAPPPPVVPSTPVKSVVISPKLLASTPPIYPPMAKQSNIQGDVVVVVNIDATGQVGEMAVTSGPEILRRAAVDAVRKWKYQPATSNGKPVSSQMSVKVEFRIR
jgi:protein TonB